MERSRPSTTVRRDDPGDFRVGRLKHERVKVPRGETMMEWAESVMHIHADQKSVLEVRGGLFLTNHKRKPSVSTARFATCITIIGPWHARLSVSVCVSRWSFRVRRERVSVQLWSFMLWWLQSFRKRHWESGCVMMTSLTMSHDRSVLPRSQSDRFKSKIGEESHSVILGDIKMRIKQ